MADKGEAWKDYFRAACTQEGIIINGETILDTQGVDEKWQDNLRAACTPAGIKVVGKATTKLYDELGQHTDGALTQKCATDNILDKQKKLIPGANINLDGDGNISAVDTTYSAFTGATSSAAGTSGLVPAPSAGEQGKCLMGDGNWKSSYNVYSPKQQPSAGSSYTGAIYLGGINRDREEAEDPTDAGNNKYFVALPINQNTKVQDRSICILGRVTDATGHSPIAIGDQSYSTTGIALGDRCKADGSGANIAIGVFAESTSGPGSHAIGAYSKASGESGLAIGYNAESTHTRAVALGGRAKTTRPYEVNISYQGGAAYGNHDRIIGGVSDGTETNDAATVGQLNNKVDKVTGKGLSTNDFTDTLKTKLDGIEEGAEVNDPDTVIDAAYVHTDNNYTSAEKTKLAGIEEGAEVNPDIDTALDASSTNPVENRVITNALNNKITVTDTDPGEGASLAANQFIAVYEA